MRVPDDWKHEATKPRSPEKAADLLIWFRFFCRLRGFVASCFNDPAHVWSTAERDPNGTMKLWFSANAGFA
jgi:hypothetical protein